MGNLYIELLEKHQKHINEFPLHFAYGDEQLQKKAEELGFKDLDDMVNNVVGIGAGGFVLKQDYEKYKNLINEQAKEFKEAMNNKDTGEQFIYEMFKYELENHEYAYTREIGSTLDALGITEEELFKNERLYYGLKKAVEEINKDNTKTKEKKSKNKER